MRLVTRSYAGRIGIPDTFKNIPFLRMPMPLSLAMTGARRGGSPDAQGASRIGRVPWFLYPADPVPLLPAGTLIETAAADGYGKPIPEMLGLPTGRRTERNAHGHLEVDES